MTQTTLFKNESYLVITSIVSVGVLSGLEYSSPVLAALLVTPAVKSLITKVTNKQHADSKQIYLNKCASCK